jgi:transcription elongation factor GreB
LTGRGKERVIPARLALIPQPTAPLRRFTGMSKAFTRETDDQEEEDIPDTAAAVPGGKNYVTPNGFRMLQEELGGLCRVERPRTCEAVSVAAANGDRSENGDYIYNKQKLHAIDRRIRFLTKRLESAEIVEPSRQTRHDKIFFGATVTYANEADEEHTITIVGIDEADIATGKVSWTSPVARALTGASVGDVVEVRLPGGRDSLEVVAIRYE